MHYIELEKQFWGVLVCSGCKKNEKNFKRIHFDNNLIFCEFNVKKLTFLFSVSGCRLLVQLPWLPDQRGVLLKRELP